MAKGSTRDKYVLALAIPIGVVIASIVGPTYYTWPQMGNARRFTTG